MKSPFIKIALIIVLTVSLSFIWAFSENKEVENLSYPEHLVGAFTGGFGEESCHSCHFDYELNLEDGALKVSGIEKIQPKTTYELQVIVEREDLGKAGFQLTARFADGRQAGAFEISEDERLMFTEQVPDSLQYVQHSPEGTEVPEKGKNQWIISWQSPEAISDSIYFNIAANAANGDQSEFGDWVYVQEFAVE